MRKKRFRFVAQHDTVDCGPACLKMISNYYGKNYSLEYLREVCYVNRDGVSLLSLDDASKKIGFETVKLKLEIDALINEAPLPAILFWKNNHFLVLKDIKKEILTGAFRFHIADPAYGTFSIDKKSFLSNWLNDDQKGIALLLEPSIAFHSKEEAIANRPKGFIFLLKYIKPYYKNFIHISAGMLFASVLSLIFPFLTQILVDKGINDQNINFVILILLSQLFLLLGQTVISLVRSFLLIHTNTRISVLIISSFLRKVMKLPIKFFDSKSVGDFMQRINDHNRIELFLTKNALTALFATISLIAFSLVLLYYSIQIFIIFLFGSIISIGWIIFFQEKRIKIDYYRFQQLKENHNSINEIVLGMQEIKLFNCENYLREKWEKIQSRLFQILLKGLTLEQYQDIGANSITILKNITISFIVAVGVINNDMTLGMMLAISYIIGELNLPLENLIVFFRSSQDAKLSLNRLSEIHTRKSEGQDDEDLKRCYDFNGDISLSEVSFQYDGPRSPVVVSDVSFRIPHGKVTAIVGASGSGKSTLLKLLLKFYSPNNGNIYVNDIDFNSISAKQWREKCGVVMQDGYIFSDTIAKNIALDDDEIDNQKLLYAAKVAHIHDYISSLPLNYYSKIGNSGSGLSTGQKQRILIARAVYKNPDFIFFDEATSALDANNERIIIDNLNTFFLGKTVVVIAHRLSTVKNADQMIVMNGGKIIEQGLHQELVRKKGYYYSLIRNQLELGN